MDPFTHFLTGACLGRSGFNRKTAYATLAMTLAAEAPDIDVVAGLSVFGGGPVNGFCHHRGITHTLLGAPFMALAVTGVVWAIAALAGRLGRKPTAQPIRWGWLWLLALIADLSHLLLDYTNNYGLRPFFPFDAHWYAWSIVFIIEPVILAALLLALLVPSVLGLVDGEVRRNRPNKYAVELRGRGWAVAALVCMGLLYALRNAEHAHAIHLVEQAGSATHEPITRVAAEPVMADPFTWHAIAETQSGYQFSTVHTLHDVVDPDDAESKPPVTPAVIVAKRSYLGRVYGDWSSWPVTEDIGTVTPPGDTAPLPSGAHTVLFHDLRFAPQAMGPLGGESSNPVLSGFVIVGQGGAILSQWMNGRVQH